MRKILKLKTECCYLHYYCVLFNFYFKFVAFYAFFILKTNHFSRSSFLCFYCNNSYLPVHKENLIQMLDSDWWPYSPRWSIKSKINLNRDIKLGIIQAALRPRSMNSLTSFLLLGTLKLRLLEDKFWKPLHLHKFHTENLSIQSVGI